MADPVFLDGEPPDGPDGLPDGREVLAKSWNDMFNNRDPHKTTKEFESPVFFRNSTKRFWPYNGFPKTSLCFTSKRFGKPRFSTQTKHSTTASPSLVSTTTAGFPFSSPQPLVDDGARCVVARKKGRRLRILSSRCVAHLRPSVRRQEFRQRCRSK